MLNPKFFVFPCSDGASAKMFKEPGTANRRSAVRVRFICGPVIPKSHISSGFGVDRIRERFVGH